MTWSKIQPPPQRIWREMGDTRCSSCYRKRRCCSVVPFGEVCFDCLLALDLAKLLRALTIDCIDATVGDTPEDEDAYWAAVDQAHAETVEATAWRMYGTPAEAKEAGYKSLEDAVRSNAAIVRVAIQNVCDRDELQPWLEAVLKKVYAKG